MMANEKEQGAMMELQRKYMEFQIIGQQVGKIREQLQQIDQQLVELDNVRESLEELKEVREGADLYVPMSSGIFLRAKAGDTGKVVLNVGASVAVEKTVAEAQQLISDQMEQAGNVREQMLANLNKFLEKAKELQAELEKLVK